MDYQIVTESDLVFLEDAPGGQAVKVNCGALRDMNITHVERNTEEEDEWFEKDPFEGREHDFEDIQPILDDILSEAQDKVDDLKDDGLSPLESARNNARLSRMNFKLALNEGGYLDDIENFMSSEDVPRKVKIMYQDALYFERMHPQLLQLADEMNYSEEELDVIFGIPTDELKA